MKRKRLGRRKRINSNPVLPTIKPLEELLMQALKLQLNTGVKFLSRISLNVHKAITENGSFIEDLDLFVKRIVIPQYSMIENGERPLIDYSKRTYIQFCPEEIYKINLESDIENEKINIVKQIISYLDMEVILAVGSMTKIIQDGNVTGHGCTICSPYLNEILNTELNVARFMKEYREFYIKAGSSF